MAPSQAEQDGMISHFCAITGTQPEEARNFLESNGWNIDLAAGEFYAEGNIESGDEDEYIPDQPEAPAPPASRRPPQRNRIATLHDLGSSDAGRDRQFDGNDDSPNLFTGGEKSGLAVHNPDDLRKRIIDKAQRQGPLEDEQPTRRSFFTGTARTLGGDDAPSRVIEDPHAGQFSEPERVRRTLNFWNNGFSVDDGELYSSDNPRNAEILEQIRGGRAPLSIMNVSPGQAVDMEIKQHDTDYVRPKPKYKAFSGSGQRLGSPTPGVAATIDPAVLAAPASSTSAEPEEPKIDDSQPTLTLQIRLGDGTRLTSRFNSTHTVGDVYDFVNSASPASQSRPWVLMTTFPSTELSDKAAVLGEMKEYQRGGVVVQKWT